MIPEQKEHLRQEISVKLKHLSLEESNKESSHLCDELFKHIEPTSIVCGYAPLLSEPDINPLLTALIERGNDVYLPRYEEGAIIFLKVKDLSLLEKGNQNILEPAKDAAPLAIETADIVLVPGRAFDKKGNRLGRGAGGYDAWIAKARMKNENIQCIGIAFDCQIVAEVPVESHDERMDALALRSGYMAI